MVVEWQNKPVVKSIQKEKAGYTQKATTQVYHC